MSARNMQIARETRQAIHAEPTSRRFGERFWSIFWLDAKLLWRIGGNTLTTVLFFATVVMLVPFGIGPSSAVLIPIGPGILWISALLSTLLTLDKLFLADFEDGTLELLLVIDKEAPIETIVLAKCLAQWTFTAIPLIMSVPALSLLMHLPKETVITSGITLIVGTPILTIIGSIGASLSLASRCNNVLMAILVIPLSIPILIFGVSASKAISVYHADFLAPFLILLALGIIALVTGPISTAAILRITSE